jgi:netrin-G3 ligand
LSDNNLIHQVISTLNLTTSADDDSGNNSYLCRADNIAGSINDTFSLDVFVAPVIFYPPNNVTVVQPNQTTLTCNASGHPRPEIAWYRQTESTNGVTERVNTNVSNVHIGSRILNSVLSIEQTNPSDAGTYTCEASNRVITHNSTAIVTVHVTPTILSPLQQTTFYVNESDYISITCSVIGLPPASITWMKDSLLLNNGVTSPNITLSINSTFNYTELATGLIYQTNQTLTLLANGSDTGSYSCVGTNAVANITTQFNIFVQVLPEVVFLNKSRVIGEVNSTILLSFALYNAAPPVDISNIQWRFSADFSNDPYTGSQDITDFMSRDGFSTYIFSSDKLSLSIIGINQMDEGRYYLIATNPAGTRFNYIDFIVHGPPRIITRPMDATIINTNDATFDCLAVADPYHHIYWTFDGQPLANTRDKINITTKYSLNSDNTSLTEYGKLTIYNVTYDDRGTYECNATNYVGNVIADAVLTVHVRPVVHDISPSSSLLISGSLSLGCLATGFPLPKIRWIKNGINLLNSTNVTMETIPVDNQLLSSFNWTDVPGNVMTLGSIGRLTFTSVARNDTANYTCEAVNSLPTSTELSAISHPITITVLERPDPPVNVVVTGYTSRTVNVSWTNGFDGNSKIKGYFVYQKDLDRNGEFIYVHSSGPHSYTAETETSTVITSGIIPYTKYQFTVVACNGVDGSNCSNFDKGIPSVPVRIEPDAPDSPPYNCTAFANSSTSISLSWFTPVEPNGLITNYTITYTPIHSISGINYTNSSSTMASTDPSNDTAITIDNLLKATSYSFTLIAYTVVGPSPSADDICFLYTLQDSPDRSPVDFRGHSGSSTSVSLYWSHPDPFYTNGIITQYRIRYAANLFAPLNQWTYMTTTNNDTNIIIDGLQKFYTYYFVIAAGTVIGFGPDTDNIPIKTLNDTSSPPQSLQLVGSPTQRSISISWVQPSELNGIITAYRVYYQPSKSYQLSDPNFNSSEAVITMGPSITSATLTNLYPSSTYNMSVTAINGAGESSRSISLSAITPPSPPDAVDSLTIPVDGIGGQTVRIELVKPSTINGQISHYHIVAVILDDSTGSLPPDSPDVQFSSINSFISYEDALTTEQVNVAYITAEFGESLFPSDNTYIIGDPNQPNDRQYTNQPLRYGTKFTFFLRAYPLLNSNNILKRQLDARQYSVFTSSDYIKDPIETVGDPGPPAAGAIVTILLIIIIIITVAIIVVLIVYKRRKGTFTPRTREQQSELLSMKSDLSLPSIPNPAYQDTSDVQSIGSFPQYEGHPPVPVGEFAKIVDRLHANENYMFSQEYDQICHTSPQPSCDVCLNPMNKLRNRYANIQAYDHSRVKLTPVEDFPHDYINANFINGYNRNNEYIATQGPLPDTVGDFWRMVWDYKSPTIIMLTNLVEKMRVKCSQYWPDNVGSTDEYGCIMVTLTKLITHADYTIRDFEIQAKDSKEIHVVKQYHYTSWPDFGVPRHPTPVIQFIHTIRRHHKPNDARPVIVHCSAGVGRTGTLMTIDVEMQRLENEAEVNPFQFVMSMRQDRNHMVQTEGQYVFIHDAIIEILTTGRTDVNSEQLEDRIQELQDENEEGETGFNLEFKRLIIDKGQFNDFTAARNDANKFKNRLHNTIPYDHNRVKLTKKPGEIGSDYINASYIDGYKAKNVFIATQGPMKNTLDDFWKMIYEQQVSIIVMMTKLEEKGQNFCTQYWPELVGTSSTFGSATVELKKMTTFEYYICRELNLTYKTRDNTDSRVVYQFHYTEWPRTGVPEQAEGLIDLIDQVNRKQHSAGNKPIVVHCNAGVGRTGTFIAMSIAIERIKTEQLVNIFNIVKHLRTQRPNMVQTLEQYMFVYKATSEYVQSFSNYANFTTVI